MTLVSRSSSSSFNNTERLRRKRLTISTLNRFSSFNDSKSSSAESRRRSFQSTPNLIELLEEDEDDTEDNAGICHECHTCSKLFASEFGVNHHVNMHHPNQSILCSHCHITFRSHRSLKTHQQRRHPSAASKINAKNSQLPNYSYVSSYLVLAFSSKQFPIMAKNACEQSRLPIGSLSSKLFQCNSCHISFPCSRSLKYHLLNKHEQYEYQQCEKTLCDIIAQVEFNLRTVDTDDNNHNNDDDNDIESIKLNLAKQAPHLGLIDKQLLKKLRTTKTKHSHLIHPLCLHENRTCANLCLKNLSSYSDLAATFSYTITKTPKGSAFYQGSIVSPPTLLNTIYSNDTLSPQDSNISNETSNGRQKRKSIKQTDVSLTSPSKNKALSSVSIANSKPNRTNLNSKSAGKQQNDKLSKATDTKSTLMDQSCSNATNTSASPRKILPKDNYARSSSISSNSSTSVRSLTMKSSASSTNLTSTAISSQRAPKRSLSPSVALSLTNPSPKRHQTRQQKQNMILLSPTAVMKNDDDHENGVEEANSDDKDDDVVPIEVESARQQRQSKRRASESSIEYVQTVNTNQQSTSSLNNIENIKSPTNTEDEEIIVCRSPPSIRKVMSSNKSHSKTSVNGNNSRRSTNQKSANSDEHVRVRCKICGEVLEGRSRFSQHVINMHSNLLKKNINEPKHQTTIVR